MVDDAAAWMRKLHGDPGLRARLGAAARVRADGYMARAWGREWIERLGGLLRAQAFLPKPPYKYSALR